MREMQRRAARRRNRRAALRRRLAGTTTPVMRRSDTDEGRPRSRRPRRDLRQGYGMGGRGFGAAEDEEPKPFGDEPDPFSIEEILDVEDDELEDLGLEEEPGECPPGCQPVEEPEDEDEPEGEDNGDEDEDEDEDEEREASAGQMWAPLMTETELKELGTEADVLMVLHGAETDDPSYTVLANGRPVCAIHRNDLDLDEAVKPMFATEAFTKGVGQAFDQVGLAEVLADLKPRYFAANTSATAEASRATAKVEAQMQQQLQSRTADAANQILSLLNLAFEGSRKNFLVHNPLRDSLRKAMRSAGMSDAIAVDLIEGAMQEGGPIYHQNLLKQVQEWMGFAPEAIEQVKKAITEATYTHPADRGTQIADDIPEMAPPQPQYVPQQRPPVATTPPVQHQAAPEDDWDEAEALVRASLGRLTSGR